MWIKLGDSMTKYFTTIMKERKNQKLILELLSTNGVRLEEPANIHQEIINFYQPLMGTKSV